MRFKTNYLSCAAFFALTAVSQAAITWQTAQNITGDATDVSLTGTLDRAYTFGVPTNHILNTVTFTGTSSAILSGVHIFAVNGPSTTVSVGSTAGTVSPYSALSAQYQGLLSDAIRAGGGTTGGPSPGVANDAFYNAYTFTLQGLTTGNIYEIQVWFNESRSIPTSYDGIGRLDATVAVDYNQDNAHGGIGQYVKGTFVASGATESFTFDTVPAPTNNFAVLNAYQVRVIPEPSHALLGAVGLLGLALRRRRLS